MLFNPNLDLDDSRSRILRLDKFQFDKLYAWVSQDKLTFSPEVDDLAKACLYCIYDIGISCLLYNFTEYQLEECILEYDESEALRCDVLRYNLALDCGYTSDSGMDPVDFVVDHIWSNLH